jgi:hypothetical protein
MSAVYKSAASQVTMTVSQLPVVAVNGRLLKLTVSMLQLL